MTTYEPPVEAVEVLARHMAYEALDWTDVESGEHEHSLECTNWWAYVGPARRALTAVRPLIAAEALEGQQGVYGESPAAGDVMMPPETLMQRMEADGRHWRNAYAEGFLSGQVSALRGFADTTRFPSHWVLFRRSDGSGVTVSDLLREAAARIARGEGS